MIVLKQNKIVLYILLLLASLTNGFLHAQPLDMLNEERKQIVKDIQHIDTLIRSIEGSQKSGLHELTLIRKKIDSRKQVLSNIDKQIDLLNAELERKQEAITILQADLESVQKTYADLLLNYYSNRNKDDWMMYIMASESVSQAYKRMRYFREILFLLQARADLIVSKTNQLNAEITDMARKQQLLQDNIGDKRKEVSILETEKKQSETVLSELKNQRQELLTQLEEKKRTYDRLTANLNEFYNSAEGKAAEASIKDLGLITERFEANKGFLSWPAMGSIVLNFGKHKHPVYKDVDTENNGIDIQTPRNADVYSIFAGVVTRVFVMPKTGEKTLVINHGTYSSVYFKLGEIFVKTGDEVKARQRIATVASTSEGSILHFEIHKKSNPHHIPLNPEQWLLK